MSGQPKFGPAGLCDSYKKAGYKDVLQAANYTADFGLEAFEYQAGHGVRIKAETAVALAASAAERGLTFSLHAPYYISMASEDEDKRLGSLRYFLQSAQAVRTLGGTRVVFHPGSLGHQSRAEAMRKTVDTFCRARELLDKEGFEDVCLCPETMGKLGQIGTLAEVLALCSLDKRHLPCVDFGHLNARGQGCLKGKKEYAEVLDRLMEGLADERAFTFHVHFSHIEYGKSGERKHLNFDDEAWGPFSEPLLELLYERKLSPVIICESAGRQAEDARTMCIYYRQLAGIE